MNQTLRYTAKIILWTIPILVGITFLAFGLGLVARGDPATNRASADPNYIPTEEEIQELRAEMGLDDPILVQYGRWIWNAAHGDLGESYIDDKPVLGEILRLLPNTLLLSGMALLVITVVGLAGGLLLTLFRDKFIDLLGPSFTGVSDVYSWFLPSLFYDLAVRPKAAYLAHQRRGDTVLLPHALSCYFHRLGLCGYPAASLFHSGGA